jgi:hypothetical protein
MRTDPGTGRVEMVRAAFEATFAATYVPIAVTQAGGAVPGGLGTNTRYAFGSVTGGSVLVGIHVGVVRRLAFQSEQFACRFALARFMASTTGSQERTIAVYLSVSGMTQSLGVDDGEKNSSRISTMVVDTAPSLNIETSGATGSNGTAASEVNPRRTSRPRWQAAGCSSERRPWAGVTLSVTSCNHP